MANQENTPERKICLIKIKENAVTKSWQFRIGEELAEKRIYKINKRRRRIRRRIRGRILI